MSNTQSLNSDINKGEYGFLTILHELGHSIGLIHTDHPNGMDIAGYYSGLNSLKYSVMDSDKHRPPSMEATDLPSGLQLLDIVAIQELYGRNYDTRSDDTEYKFEEGLGRQSIKATSGDANTQAQEYDYASTNDSFFYTIWDGEGKDTIDASDYTDRVIIDLRQGHFSSIGKSTDPDFYSVRNSYAVFGLAEENLAIAYHAIIENATGTNDTAYGDILIGNDWSNDLRGLMGDDILFGDGWIYDGSGGFSDVDLDNPDGEKPDFDNDILRGGIGADTAYGGYGHDIFVGENTLLGLEGDNYHGGGYVGGPNIFNWYEINHAVDGKDTVDYSAVENYGLTINLTTGLASRTSGGESTADIFVSIENAIGSTMADAITGTDEDNILVGLQGDDTFFASDGVDVYHGGYDLVEMFDEIHINKGDLPDLTRGEDGTDTVDYTSMTGVVFDVTVLDETLGNYWVDKYYNGTYFYGPWDRDTLFSIEELEINPYDRRDIGGATAGGTVGNNSLHYNNFGGYNVARSYYGYGGNDNITAGHKNDFLSGGTGDDNLSGSTGDDNYFYNLGDGDDYINDAGSGSIDALIFGDGILPSEVTLARYSGSNMIVTFIDNAEITLYAQTYGTGNAIDYFKFDDGTIWDMQATIVPVYGTSGNDNNLQGTGSSTTQREGAHINDVMYGYGGNDLIRSYDGDDILWGGEGDDDLRGGLDNDTLYGENGNDSMSGENGNDILYGGDGNDSMNGGHTDNGNDTLYGGGGNDTMNAFGGNDVLWGGAGLDTMAGGVGADTFVFEAASAFLNIDVITDFKLNDNDTLNIADILEGYYDFGVDAITDFVQITQSGATAYLSIAQNGGGGGSYVQIATLSNVSGQALTDEAALEASGRLITHV